MLFTFTTNIIIHNFKKYFKFKSYKIKKKQKKFLKNIFL